MTQSTSLQRAAKGSVLNVAGAGVTAVANFLLALVVARLATEDDAGLFFSAMSLFLVAVSVCQLGTNTGLVYFISGARSRGQLASAGSYMRVAAVPVLAVSVVLAVLLFAFANPVADVLSPDRDEQFADFIRMAALFIPFASLLHLGLSGTRGFGTMVPYAGIDQVARPIIQLGLVGLVLAIGDASDLAWAWPVAFVPLGLVGWAWWRQFSAGPFPEAPANPSELRRPFWAFTAPRALTTVTQVAMQRLDIILVVALADAESAAVYFAATRFLVLGQFGARAVSLGIQPLLGEALAQDDRSDAGAVYQASTSWLVLAAWPLYLVLAVFAETILQVFGDSYASEGADALRILAITMLFATACGLVDMVLTMGGRSMLSFTNAFVAFVAYVGIDLVLIPELGLVGAAYGWAAAILLANVLPLFQVRATMRLHPLGSATRLAVLLAVISYGAIPLLFVAVWGRSFPTMVAALGVATVVYVAAAVRFRSTLQIQVLLGALRSGGRRLGRSVNRRTGDEAIGDD
ncbi:MAG: lipopolysaccharide biosynthesis protein [Ilumatobacter sp.]